MQRSSAYTTGPAAVFVNAPTGQTETQVGSLQCIQKRRTYTLPRVCTTLSALADNSSSPISSIGRSVSGLRTRNESVVIKSLRLALSRPFTSLQAATQRWQPMQRVVSTRIALLMFSIRNIGKGQKVSSIKYTSMHSSARDMPRNSADWSLKLDMLSLILRLLPHHIFVVVKSPNLGDYRPYRFSPFDSRVPQEGAISSPLG